MVIAISIIAVLVATCAGLFVLLLRYKRRAVSLINRYKDVENLEAAKLHVQVQIKTAQGQIAKLESEYKEKRSLLEKLVGELSLYDDQVDILAYGLYKPHFDFETSEAYKTKLLETRDKEKAMVRQGLAATCSQQWTINGSEAQGKKQTRNYMKLMLRGFNGECDALISNVRWNNVHRMEERLSKGFEAINKLGITHSTEITRDYYTLKLDELRLTYEYQEKLHKEREEQRRIKEQMREEERAERERQKALEEVAEEEKRHKEALEEARRELETASSEEAGKLHARIAQLEGRLEEVSQRGRALSLAQLTKAGHVYIISNIGSFGDDIYKIGMTRREEPKERVQELSGASVPFPFDVHGIMSVKNAPELETRLHTAFHDRRINLMNDRREFFNVTLAEIEKVVREFGETIELIKVPEAREFRESVAMHLRGNARKDESEKKAGVLAQFPESI